MNVYKGNIVTCDLQGNCYQYLVEEKGVIQYVGNELPESFQNQTVINLGEKALIPSFADTHLHFASLALFNSGLNTMDVRSNVELKEKLKKFLPENKEKIVIAFGASPYSVQEKKLLSKDDLDEVSTDRPIVVIKYDGHACIVNTKLLNMLPDKIKELRGYHLDSGEMNQEAFFATTDYIGSTVSLPSLIKSMQKAIDYMANKGIGLMHSVSGVGFPKDIDVDMEKYIAKGISGGFQTRIFFQTMDISKVNKRKFPRIGGCFKTALDGCYGSQDAAMNEAYENTDNKGVLYYKDEEVIDFCKKANREGLQIEMHAIGDAAFDQATRALKAALDDYPREDHRHGIIHACLPTEEGIKICKEYHIQIPLQTSFIIWPQEPDWYLREIMGERESKLNPLRSFVDNNIIISAGSDSPCTDPNPMLWIHNACNHPVKEQALTVKEALQMCTYNGYWTSFDEKQRGSLEVGKIADMVILEKNPLQVPIEELKNIKVKQLYLGGKAYQGQKKSWLTTVIKGIFSKSKI